MVYFSNDLSRASFEKIDRGNYHSLSNDPANLGGKLHFVKFETSKIRDALQFIEDKRLLEYDDKTEDSKPRVLATGGGAYKYADVFLKELDVVLEKRDEFACLVSGCSFLQAAVPDECFTFVNGEAIYQKIYPSKNLYPYLLVNIGSGVSIIKVDDEKTFSRVSGSSLGGGTFWGLCRLLTGVSGFDELLELSMQGDSKSVDMLVGDIYGGRGLPDIGLTADVTASSFGKVISQDKDLSEYNKADIALALCRMVSYNIGQLAYMNALRFDLKRVLFGGFFIRGHAYTMETISFAIRFWSKGAMQATFMRHEGYLCAMGAFLQVHSMEKTLQRRSWCKKGSFRDRFKEVYTMGAPFCGSVKGPAITGLMEKIDWVEKFVQVGTAASQSPLPNVLIAAEDDESTVTSPSISKPLDLHVGVLHFHPSLETFPLLLNPEEYEPNTIDIHKSTSDRHYWLQTLKDQIATVANKAAASENCSESAQRRAHAFARSFKAHLENIMNEPTAYGVKGLAELLEMRELCLREFGFTDVYK